MTVAEPAQMASGAKVVFTERGAHISQQLPPCTSDSFPLPAETEVHQKNSAALRGAASECMSASQQVIAAITFQQSIPFEYSFIYCKESKEIAVTIPKDLLASIPLLSDMYSQCFDPSKACEATLDAKCSIWGLVSLVMLIDGRVTPDRMFDFGVRSAPGLAADTLQAAEYLGATEQVKPIATWLLTVVSSLVRTNSATEKDKHMWRVVLSIPDMSLLSELSTTHLSEKQMRRYHQLVALDLLSTIDGISPAVSAIRDLSNVTRLHYHVPREDPCFNRLVQAMQQLPELKDVKLRGAGVDSEGAARISAALLKLSLLTTLDLDHCCIGTTGAAAVFAGTVQISWLDCMQHIVLENNGVGDAGAVAIAAVLPDIPALLQLDLSGNGIEATGAEAIGSALARIVNLEFFSMSRNPIGDVGVCAISEGLQNHAKMKWVLLDTVRMGNSGMAALCYALRGISDLEELSVYGNQVDEKGCVPLFDALPLLTSLTYLHISDNQVCFKGKEGSKAAEQLHKLTLLCELGLGGCQISGASAASFACCFCRLPHLTYLDLSDNGFGDSGAASVCVALVELKSLEELRFSDNGVGFEGASFLGRALESQRYLTRLDMARNELGDAGTAEIAPALDAMSDLAGLNMSATSMQAVGAEAVANALRGKSGMTSLDLGDCNVGCATECLCTALKEMKELKYLDMKNSNLSDDGITLLAEVLSQLVSLTYLNLSAVEISIAGAETLYSSLKSVEGWKQVKSGVENECFEGLLAQLRSIVEQ